MTMFLDPGETPVPVGAPPTTDDVSSVEYAVEWGSTDGENGGVDIRPDRDDAEFTRRRYPQWPGQVVSRKVQLTVGPWQPVEAHELGRGGTERPNP